MREPSSHDARNHLAAEPRRTRGVSIPDRRRIDSDVRAFLREPSTPWIVFDREGRPPSQLAVGEVLPAAFNSVMPEHGFFESGLVGRHVEVVAEPSSLAVAADLDAPSSVYAEIEGAAARVPSRRPSARMVALGIGGVMVALLTTLAFAGESSAIPARASAARAAPVAAELPPPNLDVKNEPAEEPRSAAKRFGRLSIAGEARGREVFFDGKRLLGHGARSFTVLCGTHAIAVGSRADARDLDVPCNAELVLSK